MRRNFIGDYSECFVRLRFLIIGTVINYFFNCYFLFILQYTLHTVVNAYCIDRYNNSCHLEIYLV